MQTMQSDQVATTNDVPRTLMRRWLKPILFRAFTFALSIGIGLVLLEIGVRLFVPGKYWAERDGTTDWNPHTHLGWVQKPNMDLTTHPLGKEEVRFRTNPDGLRPADARREKVAGVRRIMVFGDSTVVGRAVPDNQALHSHLERLLGADGRAVRVINAGVQAWSNDQELLWMEELVPLYRPDLVILGVCDNDFGGNSSSIAYGMNKPRFELQENGDLHLIPPEPNAQVASLRSSGIRSWPRLSALYRVMRPKLTVLRAKLGGWEERNMLGLPNEAYYQAEAMERIDWPLFTAILARMNACCHTNGAKLILFTHPAAASVWPPYIKDVTSKLKLRAGEYDCHAFEKRLASAALQAGVEFCPLVGFFETQVERGPFHLLPRDQHCNGQGYELIASALAERIAQIDGGGGQGE